jgi:hypothetical protein
VAHEIAGLKARLAADPSRRALICAPIGGWLDLELPLDHRQLYRIEPHQAVRWRLSPEPTVDEALVYLRPGGEEVDIAALVEGLAGGLSPGARVTLLFHDLIQGRSDWPGFAARRSLSLATMRLKDLELRLVGRSRADLAYVDALARTARGLRAGDLRCIAAGAEAAARGLVRSLRPAPSNGAAASAVAIITARVAAEAAR